MSDDDPVRWDRALERLQRAAEQGSDSARRQLRLLSGGAPETAVADGDWAALRVHVSIAALTEPPERKALSQRPWVRTAERFASAAECDWLIALGRRWLESATVFDASGKRTNDAYRTNSSAGLWVHNMDLVTEVIRARISAATKLPLPWFEPPQILHYAPGQEFRVHHDFLDPANEGHRRQIARGGQRILTFLLYLNDGYIGGETYFPRADLMFRGRAGDALFFANVDREGRPDQLTVHEGRAPLSGEKWLLSQWICDRPPIR
jgi:prolyl 4-hydroxylase